MELKSNGKFICTRPIESLFTQGEKNADIIDFIIPKINNGVDLSDCEFMIAGVNIQQVYVTAMLAKSIEDSSIRLSWTVSEQFTAVSGMLMLEIRGTKGNDVIVRYSLPAVYVKEQLEGDTIAVEGTAIDDLIQQIQTALSAANSANETAEKLLQQIGDTQESLQKYDGTANEVEAARECCVSPNEGTVSGTLKERLAADFSSILQMMSSSDEKTDEKLKQYDNIVTEVENARTGSITKQTFATLSARLSADFNACLTQGNLESALSSVTTAYTEKDNALSERIDALEESLGDIKTVLEAIVEVNG